MFLKAIKMDHIFTLIVSSLVVMVIHCAAM